MKPASPWEESVLVPQVGRSLKPRRTGLTMLIDKGLGVRQTQDLLDTAAPYIDYVKFAFGTSLLYSGPVLEEKIAAIRERGIAVYPGGTLYELAHAQGKTKAFARRAKELGFTALEVSEGTIELTWDSRREMIDAARSAGLAVVTEIGKKDPSVRLEAGRVVEQIARDRQAGAQLVIIEGRDSGVGVGAYDGHGRPRFDFVDDLLQEVDDLSVLMWEAPLGAQQLFWIQRLGPDANLGNVQPADVLTLEATRQALRGDTMRAAVAPKR